MFQFRALQAMRERELLQGMSMGFRLTPAEKLSRAKHDLRQGLPVILRDRDKALLVLAAETVSSSRFRAFRDLSGEASLAITARRADTLKVAAYDGDLARLELPRGATCDWVWSVADPADDLRVPMKGPFRVRRDGSARAHRLVLQLAKDARLLPAALVCELSDSSALGGDLTDLDIDSLGEEIAETATLAEVVSARLPLSVSEAGRLHLFRPNDGGEEHYAVEIGDPTRDKPVLVRLHSACFTGDLLGSLKCDCGPQLRGAMSQMGEEGAGVLLYLNQEGRGIGLANKMRAYALQDQGFDTVEANHRLGFEDDERDFRIGAALLRQMGFSTVRLMTNNPAKVRMLEANDVSVAERVPLQVGQTRFNEDYLRTKAAKSGHML